MNKGEHLTENQLTDYFGNSALKGEAKYAVGRHLLLCDFCLKRLPQPTPEQFWTALMTDEAEDDYVVDKKALADFFKSIAESLKQPKVLVGSASALIIVLVFSAVIWLNAVKSLDVEREVAKNFELAQPIFNPVSDDKTAFPATLPSGENSNRLTGSSTRPTSEKNLPTVNNNVLKQDLRIAMRNNSNTKIEVKPPKDKNTRVSTTRGGGGVLPKCNDQPPIELTAGKSNEAVVLKWKKIQGAAKYHLYVSDDEEILIDEFETETETSYVVSKPLDATKTYNLKMVVIYEDGKSVIGDSRKFTVKNLQSGRQLQERKEKSVIRCAEKN